MGETSTDAFKIIKRVAPRLGIRFEFEKNGFTGEMALPNGARVPFLGRNLNINPSASFDLAKDKGYTSYFLKKKGFKVPEGRVFFSEEINRKLPPSRRAGLKEALAYARKLGYPLIAKPNNMSQGTLVCKVDTAGQLKDVAARIWDVSPILLIERLCVGNDYRLVILDGKLISAYQRIPVSVTGDGKSSINTLIEKKVRDFARIGRAESEVPGDDIRVDRTLSAQKLTRKSILPQGRTVQLLPTANLSTGGTSVELTTKVHPSFKKIAADATQALGLIFCGVDIMTEDITRPAASQKWWIIELNSNAQLNNYASRGKEQEKRMESIYCKILKFILKRHGRK
jgi:glutathione synthase/RimK-type ligase-like ATP-grasp enzyme